MAWYAIKNAGGFHVSEFEASVSWRHVLCGAVQKGYHVHLLWNIDLLIEFRFISNKQAEEIKGHIRQMFGMVPSRLTDDQIEAGLGWPDHHGDERIEAMARWLFAFLSHNVHYGDCVDIVVDILWPPSHELAEGDIPF